MPGEGELDTDKPLTIMQADFEVRMDQATWLKWEEYIKHKACLRVQKEVHPKNVVTDTRDEL